jgi:general secretion pathway protein D
MIIDNTIKTNIKTNTRICGNPMNVSKPFWGSLITVLLLSACTSTSQKQISPQKSYLSEDEINTNIALSETKTATSTTGTAEDLVQQNSQALAYISPLTSSESKTKAVVDLTQKFSDQELVQLTADGLPLKDYLHYVLGDLLEVSYILGEQVKADDKTITLNLQSDISKRKLFSVSEELLAERGYVIRFDDGIYYIHNAENATNKANVVYGYGKAITDVPNSVGTIVQFVPFVFGMQTSLANSLKQIVKIKATPDFDRNVIILQGKRKELIKALDFIQIMDQPRFKNRHVGVYKSTYVSTEELTEKIPELLKQEGISSSTTGLADKALSIVSLDRIGTLILFAQDPVLIERAAFWATQIDQAPSGNELQYFFYPPQFARATDLGESLQMLIGDNVSSQLGDTTSAASQNSNKNTPGSSTGSRSAGISATSENMKLVVDERANALIFQTTGDKYRQLLPLIKRLDVMPKQIILEVMIAEVTLTDKFQSGVEFNLTNQGASKTGGFNFESGASGLSYVLSGTQGQLSFNLLQTNSNVNVLSRPSLLVRDGVTATITVGNDIPTVGEIITDPVNGSQTSVVYRKTGVDLSVTPTINARGVVIMEIAQKISNQATADASVAGSPIIFERSILTEVVAESGQTIVLGGLVSENRTLNDTRVPFFSSLPLIGQLFNTTGDEGEKTELVVLVTPRIIESGEEWSEIKAKFNIGLTELKISQ